MLTLLAAVALRTHPSLPCSGVLILGADVDVSLPRLAFDAGPLAELRERLDELRQTDEAQCSEILCALLHLIRENVVKAGATELSVGRLEAAVLEKVKVFGKTAVRSRGALGRCAWAVQLSGALAWCAWAVRLRGATERCARVVRSGGALGRYGYAGVAGAGKTMRHAACGWACRVRLCGSAQLGSLPAACFMSGVRLSLSLSVRAD